MFSKNTNNNLKIIFSSIDQESQKLVLDYFGDSNIELTSVTPVKPKELKNEAKELGDWKRYRQSLTIARKNKANVIFAADKELKRLGLVVRHQKRYKYLDASQIASVYLDFKLKNMKDKGLLNKNSFIVVTKLSSTLPQKIAKQYGVETVFLDGDLSTFEVDKVKNKDGFIYAFDGNFHFIDDVEDFKSNDQTNILIAYLDLVHSLENQNKNIYSRFKELESEFGYHDTMKYDKKLSLAEIKKIYSVFRNTKSINNKKIVEKEKLSVKLTKYHFKDGSWFVLKESEGLLEVFVESIYKNKDDRDSNTLGKSVFQIVKDNSGVFQEKKFSLKSVFKYSIFVSLIAVTMYIVFEFIYKSSKNGGQSVQLYNVAGNIFDSTNRTIWLILFGWSVFRVAINAWKIKRMFMVQNEKVNTKHLFISSFMGLVVSFLTPFAIGGDAIGYWYLRRKGIRRGPLIAAFMSDTLLFQLKYTLQTIILIPIGVPIYANIFNGSDVQGGAALIWFVVGSSWTVFATIMIFTITLSRGFQEFILNKSIKLLEWTRFYNLPNPEEVRMGYRYEFQQMRQGMRDLWYKWWFPLEMIFYSFIPVFFSPLSLYLFETGWINPKVHGVNGYLASIVISDLVGTANSMSITPGGHGTGEWLNITTSHMLYQGAPANTNNYDGKTVASGSDLLNNMIVYWPRLLASSATIFTVVTLENFRIRNKNEKVISKVRIAAYSVPLISLTAYLIYFFLLF